VSDDIPIIFAEDILRPANSGPATAVFMSALSATQMQQYATAGWRVFAAPGFRASAAVDLASVPATTGAEADATGCTVLSCEVPFLAADAGARIKAWQPDILKFNCAFHNVADAESLASSMTGMGYTVLGAHWRDDNSFSFRSLTRLDYLAAYPAPEWDRINLIGVRDQKRLHALLSVARLYVGEEKRIGELRVANAIRNDHIARLEEALAVQQGLTK
jgi:hypothetical protein